MKKSWIIRVFWGILMLGMAMGAKAQVADMRVGELLNSSDWFTLEKEYPLLKDSVQTPLLGLMSEALLGYYFNRPDETLACVDSLLRYHQEELGLDNITSMLMVRSATEAKRGNYAVAADVLKDFASQLRAQGVEMDYTPIDKAVQHYNYSRNYLPMSVERPEGDVVIAMANDNIVLKIENDTVPRGTTLQVPVVVGGKEYQAIFDTGSGSTFMSAAFAEKVGVNVVADSFLIQGGRQVYGYWGFMDSMVVSQ